jgi:hypothetical protein
MEWMSAADGNLKVCLFGNAEISLREEETGNWKGNTPPPFPTSCRNLFGVSPIRVLAQAAEYRVRYFNQQLT